MPRQLVQGAGEWNWIDELPGHVRQDIDRSTILRRLPVNSIIYHVGERPPALYQVLNGSVKLVNVSEAGRELIYLMLSRGDCLGEQSVIDGEPAPMTAVAASDCEIGCILRANFLRLRLRHPEIDAALLRVFSRRLRLLSRIYFDASVLSLQSRLADRLCIIARSGMRTSGGTRDIDVHLSHDDLAKIVGSSRQTVSTLLKFWETSGFIELLYGRIRIHNLERLAELVVD